MEAGKSRPSSICKGKKLNIGLAIFQIRMERRMTLGVLSSLSGISASTISRLECGETMKLDIANAVLVAKAFNISIGEFLEHAEKCDSEESRKLIHQIQEGRRATKALRKSFFEKKSRMEHGNI